MSLKTSIKCTILQIDEQTILDLIEILLNVAKVQPDHRLDILSINIRVGRSKWYHLPGLITSPIRVRCISFSDKKACITPANIQGLAGRSSRLARLLPYFCVDLDCAGTHARGSQTNAQSGTRYFILLEKKKSPYGGFIITSSQIILINKSCVGEKSLNFKYEIFNFCSHIRLQILSL